MNRNIKVGNLVIKSKLSLAPMAGITDFVLRNLVREYAKNSLITTEMISSEALVNCPDGNIIQRAENHSPIAFQLSGHKPQLMAKAAKILEKNADIIDINMGCPVRKIVGGNDGSSLMRTPELASDIVKAIKDAVSIPVSVKFRLGWSKEELNYVEFAKLMESSGADLICVHARTRAQMYGGTADWKALSQLKGEISIPYFANGDVIDVKSAINCLEDSKADGLAIGRGVLGYPQIFKDIEEYFISKKEPVNLTLNEKIKVLKQHIKMEIDF